MVWSEGLGSKALTALQTGIATQAELFFISGRSQAYVLTRSAVSGMLAAWLSLLRLLIFMICTPGQDQVTPQKEIRSHAYRLLEKAAV
jgi:hypothetical protein